MAPTKRSFEELQQRLNELAQGDVNQQQELFLKSFIFALGDDWKVVSELNKSYNKYLRDAGENQPDLNPVQAADFLQKWGKERTAIQRRNEIKDIDLDKNDRIAFIEYLLLHYKRMILEEYYKRTEEKCEFDLSNDAVGICGVGYQLLDELFTIPSGLDPELERAIEELTAAKKVRSDALKALATEAQKGGVKGGIAFNKMKTMEQEEDMEQIKAEARINSAMRKGGKQSGDQALKKKQAAEKREKEAQAKASKDALRNRIANMGLQ